MTRRKDRDLAEDFWKKSDTESVVDFEIALAAFLATIVLTFPTREAPWIGQVAASAVLFITLIRRIAIASPFANESKIMKRTIRPIEFSTATCVIALFISLSEYLSKVLGGSVLLHFSITTVAILFLVVILHEIVFLDYFIWWYAKFNEKETRGDKFEPLWRDLKIVSYWGSMARKNRDSWRKLSDKVDSMPSDRSELFNGFEYSNFAKNVVVILLFYLVISLPSGLVGFSSGSVLSFAAFPAVAFAHDHACFLYVAYGNTSYEEFRKPIWEISLWSAVYILIVVYLLGYPPFSSLLK
jgi:hypothetical protein